MIIFLIILAYLLGGVLSFFGMCRWRFWVSDYHRWNDEHVASRAFWSSLLWPIVYPMYLYLCVVFGIIYGFAWLNDNAMSILGGVARKVRR